MFADSWKVAIIRPLLKKAGLDLIASNYRPVSNLVFLSKLIEKAVLEQFMEYCNVHALLPDYQLAYRVNYSCETSVTCVFNDILWAMEWQEICSMCLHDLSAAFDTVDHQVLLTRFGVDHTALKWFDSYLHPRYCKVNVGCSYSSDRLLDCCVPQGSLAGPNLFSVYSSTLQEHIPVLVPPFIDPDCALVDPSLMVSTPITQDLIRTNVDLNGSADDHSLKNTFRANDRLAEKQSIHTLELCLGEVKIWMDENQLHMNDLKTKFIMLGGQQQLKKCTTKFINVNGSTVERSAIVKYLGAWFDENLNMKEHITKKCHASMINIQRIKLIHRYLTEDSVKTLMMGLVVSHLDYCNTVLAGLPDIDIKRMQCVQNIAAKMILQRGKMDSSTQCLKELHWLPIRCRVKHKILTLVHKCLQGSAPGYLQELLSAAECRRDGL